MEFTSATALSVARASSAVKAASARLAFFKKSLLKIAGIFLSFIDSIGGVPWQVNSMFDERDEVLQDTISPPDSMAPAVPMGPPASTMRAEIPRKLYVKAELLQKIGYTPSCPGWKALQHKRTRVGHSDICRLQVSKKMEDTICGVLCKHTTHRQSAPLCAGNFAVCSKKSRCGDPLRKQML